MSPGIQKTCSLGLAALNTTCRKSVPATKALRSPLGTFYSEKIHSDRHGLGGSNFKVSGGEKAIERWGLNGHWKEENS